MKEKFNITLVHSTTEAQTQLKTLRETFITEDAPESYIRELEGMILSIERMYFELTYNRK